MTVDEQQGRTWDEPGGPMVEPPPDPSLAARAAAVRDAMAASHPAAPDILARMGQRTSAQLAAEHQARRDNAETSQDISAMVSGRPAQPSYVQVAKARATVDGGLDERVLARQLGRDALHRMLGVLDQDDLDRIPQPRRDRGDHHVDDLTR